MKFYRLLLLIVVSYIFYNLFVKEHFKLDDKTVSDKNNLDPNTYYRKGILKQGVSNTETPALNQGQTCTEFPSVIYVPEPGVNAVCNFGDNNINAYVPINETLDLCPLVNGVPTKTLSKITDRSTFNIATTKEQAKYGGQDCFDQKQASLPSTQTFNCTSSIQSNCDLSTTKVYNINSKPDSYTECNINRNGVWNKTINKWSSSEIDSKATIKPAINNGASCSIQASSLPLTTTYPCGPVSATCKENDPTGIKSNYNTNYTKDETITELGSFWSTCKQSKTPINSQSESNTCCSKKSVSNTLTIPGMGGLPSTTSTITTCA